MQPVREVRRDLTLTILCAIIPPQNFFDLLIHFMIIAAKIAAEIEAVRLFYHDRSVF